MKHRHPFRCAWLLVLGTLAVGQAPAQISRPPDVPAAPAGGRGSGGSIGIQIDLVPLFRALRSNAQAGAVVTEWPDTSAAQANFSLPADLVLQPTPDGDLVCEPGELLVFWPSLQAAEAGLRELREVNQLSPALRAELPALGAVLALYRLADNEAALALRTSLRARHPDWAVDLNTRSASQAGPRLFSFSQLQLAPSAQGSATASAGTRVGVIDGPTDALEDLQVASLTLVSMLQPGSERSTLLSQTTIFGTPTWRARRMCSLV